MYEMQKIEAVIFWQPPARFLNDCYDYTRWWGVGVDGGGVDVAVDWRTEPSASGW